MTVQQAAASTALILGVEKRKNGRWVRNTHTHESVSMDRSTANAVAQAGTVLDELGRDALEEVRDGIKSLNSAYEFALARTGCTGVRGNSGVSIFSSPSLARAAPSTTCTAVGPAADPRALQSLSAARSRLYCHHPWPGAQSVNHFHYWTQEATMATQTTATFPTLQQTQIQSLLVQPLEAASVFLASGPKIIDTHGPIRIPRIASGLTVGAVAEGATIPESSVGMDEVTMLPSTLKSFKVISRVTAEVLRSSAVALDSILKQRLTTDTAAALDTALFAGTGATNTIRGLLSQTGVATGTLNAADPDTLLDGIGVARANEVTPNRWFLSPADYLSIRKVKDNEGRYVLQPDITQDGREVLFGIPVTVTSRIPTGKAILADMSLVAVARDLAPSITVDSSVYFTTDEVALRVVCRYDLALLQPKAVTVLTATP